MLFWPFFEPSGSQPVGRDPRGGHLTIYRGSLGTFRNFKTKLSAYKFIEFITSDAAKSLFQCQLPILSQVFCIDILFFFPHHKLFVKQDFQFVGSPANSLLPKQVQLAKVVTTLAAGPLL